MRLQRVLHHLHMLSRTDITPHTPRPVRDYHTVISQVFHAPEHHASAVHMHENGAGPDGQGAVDGEAIKGIELQHDEHHDGMQAMDEGAEEVGIYLMLWSQHTHLSAV